MVTLYRRRVDSRLRPILIEVADIADPLDRLVAIENLRRSFGEVLTGLYEKASWDVRAADRVDEAVEVSTLTKTALLDYSIGYNRRLGEGLARTRWADPLRPHGLQDAVDISKVGNFEVPKKVRPRRRKVRPYRPKKRNPHVPQLPPVVEDHPANAPGYRRVEGGPTVADGAQVNEVLRHVQARRAAHAASSTVVNFLPEPGATLTPAVGPGLDDGTDPGGDHVTNV